MANQKPVGIAYKDPDLTAGWAIDGVAVTATAAELNAGSGAGVTPGTVTASKGVVVDANKDIAAFRNLGLVNLDAGSSGVAGSVDIFPTTASKGKVAFTKTDNTNDDTTSIVFGAHAAARTITLPDPGGAANFVLSTGTSTATSASSTDLNKIAGITNGTTAASKALVTDANSAVSAVKTAALSLGASGSETLVTATGAEVNKVDGVPYSCTVVVTTPGASGTCDAAFTFKDAAGATIAIPVAMDFYLSGVDGLTITAAITSITAADTPVGAVGAVTTGQQGKLVTTAGGLGSVKLTGTAATSYYITFLGLGGRLIVSPALLTKA